MEVKINGVKHEVEVSNSGVFSIKNQPTIHARTLEALKRKAAEVLGTGGSGIPVYSTGNANLGVVIGRKVGRGWQGSAFRVKWDDTGNITEVRYGLLRELTPAQLEEYSTLKAVRDLAQAAARTAQEAVSSFESQHEAITALKVAFPEVK